VRRSGKKRALRWINFAWSAVWVGRVIGRASCWSGKCRTGWRSGNWLQGTRRGNVLPSLGRAVLVLGPRLAPEALFQQAVRIVHTRNDRRNEGS